MATRRSTRKHRKARKGGSRLNKVKNLTRRGVNKAKNLARRGTQRVKNLFRLRGGFQDTYKSPFVTNMVRY